MRKLAMLLLITALFPWSLVQADEENTQTLKVGDPMPSFELPYASKDTMSFDGISSESLLGQRYVVATFPAAWSGGCTKEMCTFRDEFSELSQLDAEILPVSGDYIFASYSWAKHHELPFKLMADHDREFGVALGVFMPKYAMFQRSVFVVNEQGKLAYVDYEYSIRDDADFELLKEALGKK